MRLATLDVLGQPTRVLHAGHGPGLLLIHGGDLSADVWLRNVDALAGARHVVRADLPGHGATGLGDLGEDVPHPYFLAHLEAVVDAFGMQEYAVIGSSLGAHLAVLLHLRQPAGVTALVLVGSASTFASDAALTTAVAEATTAGMAEVDAPTLDACRASLARYFPEGTDVPEFLVLQRLVHRSRAGAGADWSRIFRGLADPARYREHRVVDRLEEVRAPTLVVWGGRDQGARLADATAGIGRLPCAVLELFDDSGHMPFVDEHDRFNALIGRFLESPREVIDRSAL